MSGDTELDLLLRINKLKLALFRVARDRHSWAFDHPIDRFTECNHPECEAVHALLGDMEHPTEEELKAVLEP